jgi:hypothetical protein
MVKIKYAFLSMLIFLFFPYQYSFAYEMNPLTGLALITVNAEVCKKSGDYTFAVCILNKTGRDLNEEEVKLGEHAETENKWAVTYKRITFGSLQKDKYLIIESSPKKINEGDTLNHLPFFSVLYSLEDGPSWEHLCHFNWNLLVPPYYTPTIYEIEVKRNGLKCHFKKMT